MANILCIYIYISFLSDGHHDRKLEEEEENNNNRRSIKKGYYLKASF